ncbi:MAG TPA: nuclear transport factor 2 family protein [Novosphingobium sp.]|nr:nuclear transport factor 2 family protein [Novosphingobium sp.]
MADQALDRTPLGDHSAIVQQVYAYCRAMDRMDVELGYSIWHEDGEADYGEAIYQGSGRGFIDFVTRVHADYLAHSHQISNVLVKLDGNRAASESYVTAVLRRQSDGALTQFTVHGRYLDLWSCRNGRWAIDKRMFVTDFDEIRTVVTSGLTSRSRREPSDASYTVFAMVEGVLPNGTA